MYSTSILPTPFSTLASNENSRLPIIQPPIKRRGVSNYFWFDLLAKFMSIRATGKPLTEETTEEKKNGKKADKKDGG